MATSGMLPPRRLNPTRGPRRTLLPITAFLRHQIGITLEAHRMGLLQARLRSRLQVKDFKSFTQFHEQVLKADPSGWGAQLLIDLSTVNHTAFFREPGHFTFMAEKIAGWLKESPGMPVRIWSAGCSSGQEPYSMAMVPGRVAHQPLAAEGRNLGQRPLARDAQDCRRRDLHHPRRTGSFARAAPAVLPARARPARRLVPHRSRDPRPGQVPPYRSAQPDLARPHRLPDHFLPERLDLFRRGRAIDSLEPAGATPAPGGWLAMGNGEILPEVPPSLRKHSPSLFQKEG